jgi:integrase
MSRKRKRQLPGYLLHKASGQARVVINGKDIWLGKHGTSESHDRYDEEISKVLEQTRLSETNISISEVLAAFWAFAKKRYGNTGKGRYGAAVSWRPIIRLLRERHGDDRPRDFGPLALRALIEEMPSHGWNRRYANDHIGRIKRIFKWAASQELVDHSVYQRLLTVAGIRFGEFDAMEEPAEVEPVADSVVAATIPFLSPMLVDMVHIQRLTACRPGELLIMRPSDIDRTSDIWLFVPERHKSQHRGKKRSIAIGPRAQELLAPHLLKMPTDYCFPSGVRTKYTTDSYRRAIQRACDRAFPAPGELARQSGESERARMRRLTDEQKADLLIWQSDHHWSPHQLRHAAGTAIREEFDVEYAQAMLGHSRISTTEIYAQKSKTKMFEAARKLG